MTFAWRSRLSARRCLEAAAPFSTLKKRVAERSMTKASRMGRPPTVAMPRLLKVMVPVDSPWGRVEEPERPCGFPRRPYPELGGVPQKAVELRRGRIVPGTGRGLRLFEGEAFREIPEEHEVRRGSLPHPKSIERARGWAESSGWPSGT